MKGQCEPDTGWYAAQYAHPAAHDPRAVVSRLSLTSSTETSLCRLTHIGIR
jgi:hypothetical protein